MIRVDLHVHTPESYDYHNKSESWLSVVEAASEASLDLIAIADHNTFEGYKRVTQELQRLQRTDPDKHARISTVTVLPGIEVSCLGGRGGLHVVGVFDPSISRLGYIGRSLGLKRAAADDVSGGTRLTKHVEEVVGIIHRYQGLAIAAHVGSRNGLLLEFQHQFALLTAKQCQFDALEYSKESRREEDQTLSRVEEVAEAIGAPVIASSDAHSPSGSNATAHPWGVGERWTELDCDRADFASIRRTFARRENVHRESTKSVREPWVDEPRLRDAVQRGKSLTFDYIYSDRDMARIIKVSNSLLNEQGGSLLIGVGGGRERLRIGSRRLSLSEAELKATIEASMNPTPAVEVLSGEFTDGRRMMQVLVHKAANPLFYMTKAGRAYGRDKGQVKTLELGVEAVVGPFLRELGRSSVLDRRNLMNRASSLRTDRHSALLTQKELSEVFPMRRYLDELPVVPELVAESIVEAAARVKDVRLRTWAQELDISPSLAERIMADKARQYSWAQYQAERYKPLLDDRALERRHRTALSAANAALKRRYLQGREEVEELDTPLAAMADNLGHAFEWREPRLDERMRRIAFDAQRELETLVSETAGRVNTFLLEVGQAVLDAEGVELVKGLLEMPETEAIRRVQVAPREHETVVLVPTETPTTLSIEDILELFMDQEELGDDEAVCDRLEHIIRVGLSTLPLWIWVRQFSSRASLEAAVIELRERREARVNRKNVLRRITNELDVQMPSEQAARLDHLIKQVIEEDDPDSLECLFELCIHEPGVLEECTARRGFQQRLGDIVEAAIHPTRRLFRFASGLLCLMGRADQMASLVEDRAPIMSVPAGIEAFAFSKGPAAIPDLEELLASASLSIAYTAARCLVWSPQYGVSRLSQKLADEEGETPEQAQMNLRALARAMGHCRLQEFLEAAEALTTCATRGSERPIRVEARNALVQLDRRRYLPEARAKFRAS
jgi:hypothetical protein